MKIYCNTYNYIFEQNNKRNGNFRINYEPSLTENLINYYILDTTDKNIMTDKILNNNRNIKINYFNCDYTINRNRRMFDNFIETAPHRIANRY
jgi:hypothetical protein